MIMSPSIPWGQEAKLMDPALSDYILKIEAMDCADEGERSKNPILPQNIKTR
jgi:hypothetical protein